MKKKDDAQDTQVRDQRVPGGLHDLGFRNTVQDGQSRSTIRILQASVSVQPTDTIRPGICNKSFALHAVQVMWFAKVGRFMTDPLLRIGLSYQNESPAVENQQGCPCWGVGLGSHLVQPAQFQ